MFKLFIYISSWYVYKEIVYMSCLICKLIMINLSNTQENYIKTCPTDIFSNKTIILCK
jgi:hypothetical protein